MLKLLNVTFVYFVLLRDTLFMFTVSLYVATCATHDDRQINKIKWKDVVSLLCSWKRSTREGNIYTWECLSVHHWWGRGTPSRVWVGGGYPVPGLLGGAVPHPRSGWGEYPIPGLDGEGGYLGYPISWMWMVGGTPQSDLDGGGGLPQGTPTRTEWGTPPPCH